MPRQSKQASSASASQNKTFVLDNGGYTIKAGFASLDTETGNDCRIIPNCIARTRKGKIFVADQLDGVGPEDTAEIIFRRPVDKGYIVNWDGEFDIWKQAFFSKNAVLPVSYCRFLACLTPNLQPQRSTQLKRISL